MLVKYLANLVVNILPDKNISNKDLIKTDALIVRSGTTVNEHLLKNTPVKFVGTATSGTDHIDKTWLKKNKIYCVDAVGSNAISVSNYVISAILSIANKENIILKGKKIAIIGCGNVGTELVSNAEAIGLITLINDPPRASQKPNGDYYSKLESLKKDFTSSRYCNNSYAHNIWKMVHKKFS